MTVLVLVIVLYQTPTSRADLLVTSFGNDKVMRYDQVTGAFLGDFLSEATVASGEWVDGPTGISVGPDGLVYVSGQIDNTVKRYDASTGAFFDTFASPANASLSETRRMAFGPSLHISLYLTIALSLNSAAEQLVNDVMAEFQPRLADCLLKYQSNEVTPTTTVEFEKEAPSN